MGGFLDDGIKDEGELVAALLMPKQTALFDTVHLSIDVARGVGGQLVHSRFHNQVDTNDFAPEIRCLNQLS